METCSNTRHCVEGVAEHEHLTGMETRHLYYILVCEQQAQHIITSKDAAFRALCIRIRTHTHNIRTVTSSDVFAYRIALRSVAWTSCERVALRDPTEFVKLAHKHIP